MSKKNYYEILGVDKKATSDEIKKKYRSLSLKWHPDKWANKTEKEKKEAEEKFKDIAEAYSILSDENKRKQYDMFGTVDNSHFSGGFDPFEMFRNMSGFDDFNPFGNFRQRTKTVTKGSNIKFNTKITLEEIYNNSEHTIKYKRYKPCKECDGKGTKTGKIETCPYCQGTGVITETYRNGFVTSIQQTPCKHCNGTGEKISDPCTKCGGSGLELVEETFKFKIPVGCTNGAYTSINGAGNFPERNNGIPGDLILVFNVQSNEKFTISESNQFDILTSVEIPVLDCITGCTTTINDVSGKKLDITIPINTRHKDKIVLKDKGLPTPYGNRGNLIVYINQKMPDKLTDSDIKTINKLKKIFK